MVKNNIQQDIADVKVNPTSLENQLELLKTAKIQLNELESLL